MWVEGGPDPIDPDPSLLVVRFTDPERGVTYYAVSVLDGERERGVGASLLTHANNMSKRAAGNDLIFGTPDDDAGAREAMDRFIDNIEVLRLLTQQLEFGTRF